MTALRELCRGEVRAELAHVGGDLNVHLSKCKVYVGEM